MEEVEFSQKCGHRHPTSAACPYARRDTSSRKPIAELEARVAELTRRHDKMLEVLVHSKCPRTMRCRLPDPDYRQTKYCRECWEEALRRIEG